MIATYISGSYSIISSLVDSCVDLTSGGVIWMTERAIRKRDPYRYPRGRTRLEPLALIIISVVMAVASIQVIVQSLEAIVSSDFEPNVHFVPITLMLVTIAVKLALYSAGLSSLYLIIKIYASIRRTIQETSVIVIVVRVSDLTDKIGITGSCFGNKRVCKIITTVADKGHRQVW